MPGPGQGFGCTARSWVTPAVLFVVVALAALPEAAVAGDRTNLPLKNWGGFSLYRDAAYDDLERLVTAGLADRTLLNTKPLSRVEAARIVARAIERIGRDESGGLNTRRDLEPVLDRLMEEFKVELAGLGVRLSEDAPPPGMFSFTPVDRAQVFAAYASQQLSLANEQGRSLQRGANGGLTFESRMQIGDFLTFYVQPELLVNEDYTDPRGGRADRRLVPGKPRQDRGGDGDSWMKVLVTGGAGQRIVDRGRHSLRESAGLQQTPEKNVRIKKQFHRLVASHSPSGTAGETMSPVILPVVRNEPRHDFGCFGSGGGLTWAIGSPFRGTRMGFPVLLTFASTAKQVALNLEIVISSGSMEIYYYGHQP